MTDPWKRKDGKEVPLAAQLEINTLLDAYVKGDGSDGLRKGTVKTHPIRTYWDDAVPMIEAAKPVFAARGLPVEQLFYDSFEFSAH